MLNFSAFKVVKLFSVTVTGAGLGSCAPMPRGQKRQVAFHIISQLNWPDLVVWCPGQFHNFLLEPSIGWNWSFLQVVPELQRTNP